MTWGRGSNQKGDATHSNLCSFCLRFNFSFSRIWWGSDNTQVSRNENRSKADINSVISKEKIKYMALLKQLIKYYFRQCYFSPLCLYSSLKHVCLCLGVSVNNSYNYDFRSFPPHLTYRIPSNKRPWRLLNFETVRCGAY